MISACSFIFMQIKVVFIRMVSLLDSLWNRGTRELGNGLLPRLWWFLFVSSHTKLIKISWLNVLFIPIPFPLFRLQRRVKLPQNKSWPNLNRSENFKRKTNILDNWWAWSNLKLLPVSLHPTLFQKFEENKVIKPQQVTCNYFNMLLFSVVCLFVYFCCGLFYFSNTMSMCLPSFLSPWPSLFPFSFL